MMIGDGIDELFMLGADPPEFPGLLTLGEARDELVAVFDDRRLGRGGGLGAHAPGLERRARLR
ncbi:hypothetical protein D9M73_123690 [compost metagenome]